ncbi:MAG: O-antigen ligase family protein [Bacteroidota bacterium]
MKWLLGLTLLSMAVPHLGNLGLFGYLPVIGCLGLILFLRKRVALYDALWYNLGGGLCLLGMLIGSVQNGGLVSLAYVAFGVLLFFFYPLLRGRGLERYVLKIVLVCLLLTLIPLGFNAEGLVSIYDNPNNYSGIALSVLYLGVLTLYRSRGRQLLLFCLMAVLIFLGASRSILGAVAIFGVLYFLQRYVLRRTLKWGFVVGFSALCFAYYSLITDDRYQLLSTIQSATVSEKKNKGLSHRDQLFTISLGIARDYPEGVGMGRSNQVIGERYVYPYTPHNTFLKALVEGGVIMLLGFCILLIGFLVTSNSPLATAFIFAFILRGLFESSTPLSISLISSMWIIPMFLDEESVIWEEDWRLRLFPTIRLAILQR